MDGRTKKALVVGALSLVVAATCLAGIDLDQRYGPYECAACAIRTPIIDDATKAFIDKLRAPLEIPFIDRTWVVCNATVCADYVVNVSGNYEGSNRRAIEGGSAGGGGGGCETGGNGGGYNPGYNGGGGGGGSAGGSGKVNVGDPSVIEN
ncbi:hypothetical protein [Lysobacter sp. Root667]|uniref:hypothetical protein n=1 Tax=Lysobacter sp. Root667 TaxID=1736581 RepID=UPI0012DCBDBD|nr:hypothetical protein [Lysobacter sp. Root667]